MEIPNSLSKHREPSVLFPFADVHWLRLHLPLQGKWATSLGDPAVLARRPDGPWAPERTGVQRVRPALETPGARASAGAQCSPRG